MSTEPGLCRQADQTGDMRVTAPTFAISLPCSAAMSVQSSGEAVNQSGSGEGLGQEANCPGVQRLGADALIGKGRDEDERHKVTLAAYNRHKFRAAHNRHLHIPITQGVAFNWAALQDLPAHANVRTLDPSHLRRLVL